MHYFPRIRPHLPNIALIAAALSLASCQQPDDQSADNESASEPAMNLPSVPRIEPPVDRAALLAAVVEAASAAAAGAELPDSVKSLDGRQFEIRIRFGCRGPSTDLPAEWLGWSFDPQSRTLRVRAKPTISADDAMIAKIAGDAFEAVEGFWIPRPWLQQAVCPARAAVKRPDPAATTTPEGTAAAPGEASARPAAGSQPPAPGPGVQIETAEPEPVPTAPRIGIAQFFRSDEARTGRRDERPYSSVKTLPEGAPLSSQGFDLVLTGRLRALPDAGVVQCVAKDANTPPECVISAEFLRVWIEQPQTREIVAEWGSG